MNNYVGKPPYKWRRDGGDWDIVDANGVLLAWVRRDLTASVVHHRCVDPATCSNRHMNYGPYACLDEAKAVIESLLVLEQ